MSESSLANNTTNIPQKVAFENSENINFENLVSDNFPNIFPETMIKGEIIDITKDFVIVDIGYKSYGRIPYSEFLSLDGQFTYAVGDQVDIYIEYLENQEGQAVLSREKAVRIKVWEEVTNIFDQQGTIKGCITGKTKGGLSVDIGIKSFLPGSQIDLRPTKDLDALIGKSFDFKILKFDQNRNNVVLSRRAILEVNLEDKKQELLQNLKPGDTVKGHVKNITDYGVFIDLGGIDGLLHITDMTWGRISHPSELYQIGDDIEVIVLSYDKENQKVSLGLKQKDEDPWENLGARLNIGDQVSGKVVNITNYGAFIEIDKGVEGLLHISEMSWTKKIKTPDSVLSLGEIVETAIKEIDFERRRISLSLRDLQSNPWENIAEKYMVGQELDGIVRNITDFGIFVEVEEGIDGLVHSSDISWGQRNKNRPQDMFTQNQNIKVKLLSIDVAKGRLSLGIKQLTEDPWKDIDKELHIGDEINGTVVHVADFGVFVELKEGLEGLIHLSEIGRELTKQQMINCFPLNSKIPIRVLKIDANEKRLALSPIDFEERLKDLKSANKDKKSNTDSQNTEKVTEKNNEADIQTAPIKEESAQNTAQEESTDSTQPKDDDKKEAKESSSE